MNKMILVGRLTKDPELKSLDNGNKVCNITLAIDREYKDKEGNKITDFLPLSLWGKDAENICRLSRKGAIICIDGTLNMKEVEEDGIKKYVFNPKVNKVTHLANKYDYSNNQTTEITEEMEK